jgi:hypothetical protein
VNEFLQWDRRTAALLEEAYVAAGAGPGGSGSGDLSDGAWRAKRQHLTVPMDRDGTWLDVGCANGHLLATFAEVGRGAWCHDRSPWAGAVAPGGRVGSVTAAAVRWVDLDRIGDVVDATEAVPVCHRPR